jgi:hypothetical protein
MKTNTLLSWLLLALLSLASVPGLRASTIFWGSLPNDHFFDSQGNALNGSYTFELGVFISTFTPTLSNMDQWAVNWRVFDAATAGSGWDVVGQELSTSADHLSNSTSSSGDAPLGYQFLQGTKAYLWVYNSKSISLTSEWALVTDDNTATNTYQPWLIPDPADTGGSADWQTRDLDTALYGGVNDVQGPGLFSVTPGTFTIQTHAVPEPGSALLCALAASLLLCRTRRAAAPRSLH